jgi:hypothetical protein
MRIALDVSTVEEVADTRCAMSLIDTRYLTLTFSKIQIIKMSASINVRDIENVLHQSFSYVMLDLYLNGTCKEKKTRAHIRRKFHIVKELKCKILMRLDIMTSKKMIINLTNKSLIISICENMTISIRINSKSNFRIRRIVHSKDFVTISSNAVTNVLTYMREKKLSLNRDFLFELNHEILIISLEELDDLYTHVCDCNIAFVHVRNATSKSVLILSKSRLDLLIEYEEKECFQVESKLHEWAVVCNEADAEEDFS